MINLGIKRLFGTKDSSVLFFFDSTEAESRAVPLSSLLSLFFFINHFETGLARSLRLQVLQCPPSRVLELQAYAQLRRFLKGIEGKKIQTFKHRIVRK